MATRRITVFDGSSAQSSTYTSNAILVADADRATISTITRAAAASRFTVQASNADGFSAALVDGDFSDITTITVPGIYTMDTGFAWVRVARSAIESQSTVHLNLLNTPYL